MGSSLPVIALRSEMRPGDLGEIVRMHGTIYARENGFDRTFEAYVAGPLAQFTLRDDPRERIWIADGGSGIAGCVVIVAADDETAQLRWFLVQPAARGRGLGSLLVDRAIAFSRERGYAAVVLWTVESLTAAARIYRSAGFEVVERRPGRPWGVDVVEEKYALRLS